MSWKHRDAKREARLIRRTLQVPYDEMFIVWWPDRQGANVMKKEWGLVSAHRYTTRYLLAQGAQLKKKSGWES